MVRQSAPVLRQSFDQSRARRCLRKASMNTVLSSCSIGCDTMTSQLIGPSSRPYIAGLSRRQLHRFYATTREAPAAAAANIQKSDAASEMTDAGQQVAVTAAPSKDKAAAVSASPSTAWMKKQMDQMSFLETRKQKPAMKVRTA